MKYPSFIQLYPTLRCNQDCGFCFNRNISSDSYGDMNDTDADALGNLLIKNGMPEIDILGGEPMLMPWIRDFTARMTGSGVKINISTNGSLHNVLEGFMDMEESLLTIGFSVHGFSRTHDALTKSENFSCAVRGIRKMIDAGKDPLVKSVLLRENKNEIFELVHYIAELGVKRYFLLYEDTIGREAPRSSFSFPEFYDIYSQVKTNSKSFLDVDFVAGSGFHKYGGLAGRCDAGTEKIAILPDGSTFPCNLFAGFKEFRLGNIFEDGIEQILQNPFLESFRNYGQGNPCKVIDCRNYSACKGGCPAHNYFFCHTLDTGDPRCRPCADRDYQ
jgi:radical SAM protein with 4Fe4S-binding SPASM domain